MSLAVSHAGVAAAARPRLPWLRVVYLCLVIGAADAQGLSFAEFPPRAWAFDIPDVLLAFTVANLVLFAGIFVASVLQAFYRPGKNATIDFKLLVLSVNALAALCRVLWLIDPFGFHGIYYESVAALLHRAPEILCFFIVLLFVFMWKRIAIAAMKVQRIRSVVIVGRFKWTLAALSLPLLAALVASVLSAADVLAENVVRNILRLVFGVYALGCTAGGLVYAWQLDRHLKKSAGKSLKVRARVRLTVACFVLAGGFWLAMFLWSVCSDALSPTQFVLYTWSLLAVEAVVGIGAVSALYTGGRANLLPAVARGPASRRRATTHGIALARADGVDIPQSVAAGPPVATENALRAASAAATAAAADDGAAHAAADAAAAAAGVVLELEPRKGSGFLRVLVVHEPGAARAAAASDPGRQARILSMRASSERAQILNPLNSYSNALSARRLQL